MSEFINRIDKSYRTDLLEYVQNRLTTLINVDDYATLSVKGKVEKFITYDIETTGLRGLHCDSSALIILDECSSIPANIWDYVSIRMKQIEISHLQSGTVLKFDPDTKTFKRYPNIPNR